MRKVYKNTVLNVVAQVIVMVIMFFAIPWIVKGLGDVSFAILSLIWTVITYFTLWDLGIGRAVTKFVAEKKASGKKDEVVAIIYQSIFISLLLGAILGFLLFIFEDQISASLFKVPAGYHLSILFSLRLVAFSMPILVLQGTLRGALMGLSRFDLSNFLQVVNGALQWGGALLLVLLRFDVVWIIGLILFSRVLTTIWHIVFVRRIVGLNLNREIRSRSLLRKILNFGGWAMVSQVVSPLLQYTERFMLSAMVATGTVTFYVVPYEATSKMLVLSVGLVSALFPEMSEIYGSGGLSFDFKRLYNQSERILVFTFLPIGAFLFMFTPEVLRIWMGSSFAQSAGLVFEILSLAFLLNSIAQLPFTLLQAVGRSDLTGKIHLIELPIHFLVAFMLIRYFGLVGAAGATLFRIVMDAALLYAFTSRKLGLRVSVSKDFWKNLGMPASCLIAGVVCMLLFQHDIAVKVVLSFISFLFYGLVVFKFSLADEEKKSLMRMVLRRANA